MNLTSLFIYFLCLSSHGLTSNTLIPIDKQEFEFSIYSSNHAELIYKGQSVITIKKSQVNIYKNYLGSKKPKLVFCKSIDSLQQLNIENACINLNKLADSYINKCVFITSGDEYNLHFQMPTISKSISLHSYYLPEVEQVIILVNEMIPEEYRIDYVDAEHKQDCK